MGRLIDGTWHRANLDVAVKKGAFVRADSHFRRWITADGSSGFPAEPGRYHLYVSLACPWAHRTLIFRALKGLESVIGVTVVSPDMMEDGWVFNPGDTGPVDGVERLYEIYQKADPAYSGRVTVPTLWDTKDQTIVSNESAEIIRMFNSAFNAHAASREQAALDFYPEALQPEIDAANARIYETVNNGVYRAGFATEQDAYDTAVNALFDSLDWLEERLARQRYVAGDRITEADWRLFTTLVRFDAVYHGHFKCNHRRLVDYPNLWAYTRELYQQPGVAATVDLGQIRRHYYFSQRSVNPTGIVAHGPRLDFSAPHGRETALAA